MQQRQNGRQLIFFGVATILVVLIIGFMLTHSGGGSKQAAAEATAPVVMAQQTIPAGTVFKSGQPFSDSFQVKQIPSSLVPFGAYRSLSQLDALTHPAGCGPVQTNGCDGEITTTQTIYQDTPVVTGMFSTLGQYRQSVGPSFAIPYGYVGIAVSFDQANSVLGSISPGDSIDLIASWKGGKVDSHTTAPRETQYALDNVRVISVNAPPSITGAATVAPSSSSTSASTTSGGTLVLLVRYQEALEIQHLKDFGWTLSCVLRSAHATNIPHFRTLPVTDKWFFSKSGNPFSSNPGY